MSRSINPQHTKAALTQVALRVAVKVGFTNLSQAKVSTAAGCAYGTITARFGTMTALRRDVMRAALAERCLPVIAEGLALRHPTATKAPQELKDAALRTLSA